MGWGVNISDVPHAGHRVIARWPRFNFKKLKKLYLNEAFGPELPIEICLLENLQELELNKMQNF